MGRWYGLDGGRWEDRLRGREQFLSSPPTRAHTHTHAPTQDTLILPLGLCPPPSHNRHLLILALPNPPQNKNPTKSTLATSPTDGLT